MPVPDRKILWQKWASALRRWGLSDIAAEMFAATRPLHLVGAQLIYLGEPFFAPFLPGGTPEALATLLEDPEAADVFIAYLRASP